MKFEIGDILLCTVDRIVGTIVFVKIEDTNQEGSIIMSEIFAGRIRNIRDYVVPKKKIVCKILQIMPNGNMHLSLRRVTQKEKKEVIEKYKQERSYESVFKSILGDKSKKIIKEIKEQNRLYEFVEEIKKDPTKLEKLVSKTDSKKILEILKKQKKKKAIIKKEFNLTTTASDGLEQIKNVLTKIKDAEVKYISAGKYSIKTEAQDMKSADNNLKKVLEEIEKQAKKHGMEFSIKGK